MRPTATFAAVLLTLGLASAASAATVAVPRAPTPAMPAPGLPGGVAAPETPVLPADLRTVAEGLAEAAATASKLAALEASQEADEARMTQLRDWELSMEDKRLRAIRPVLPYHGISYLFPHWY
jgi:hypothetical protein